MEQSLWHDDTRVQVLPFTRGEDGEDVIIGRPETNTFLALPLDALFFLDLLCDGSTIGQAKKTYQNQYGIEVDAEEFLALLAGKGFVRRVRGSVGEYAVVDHPSEIPREEHRWLISRDLARQIVSTPVICTLLGLIGVAAILCAVNPDLIPRPRAVYFHNDRSAKLLVVTILVYLSTFIHELGHVVAGRAEGLAAPIGIGHRLWIVVLETDLTGLWAFPKRQRYFPILAGCLVDGAITSALLVAAFAATHGYLALTGSALEVLRALTYLMLMRILWQFFLFVRTDIYFLIATALNCRNLLTDSEAYLRTLVSRVLPWVKPVDQSAIPRRERRLIAGYAVVWVLGRILAFYALLFLTLPILIFYLRQIYTDLLASASGGSYRFFDALVMALVYVLPIVLGLFLWIKNLLKSWKEKLWKSNRWPARRKDGIEVP